MASYISTFDIPTERFTPTNAPSRLDIAQSGTNLALSWPAYGTGLGLGQRPDPTTNFVVQYSSPGNGLTWSNLPPLPIMTNLTDTLVLSPATGSGLYRLKRSF
jgi:hypothetical protein